MTKTILDLCGGTGAWSRPYAKAGYDVLIVDIQDIAEDTPAKVFKWSVENYLEWCTAIAKRSTHESTVHGILCAPPCTHFSGSGAQYWKAKDADGRTDEQLAIVDACLDLVELFDPVWWILENPVGRLPKLRPNRLGAPLMRFQPHEYGDPWTKRTCLWGNFTIPEKNPVEPVGQWTGRANAKGIVDHLDEFLPPDWLYKLGPSKNRAKLRSITPPGFAQAFFEANP